MRWRACHSGEGRAAPARGGPDHRALRDAGGAAAADHGRARLDRHAARADHPLLAQPLYIFLFYSFFLGIPRELEEAAKIDGAGAATTFFRIAAPLAKPAYAAAGILIFLASWGQYLWPVMVTRSIEARPCPWASRSSRGCRARLGDIMAYAAMMVIRCSSCSSSSSVSSCVRRHERIEGLSHAETA